MKTIVYSFEELREAGKPQGEAVWCLFRRELDWEQAHPAAGRSQSRDGGDGLPSAADALEAAGQVADPTSPEFDPLLVDEAIVSVPEVTHFALRYFDGATWSEEWDSVARGGLPRAVEVAMRLRSHEQPEVPDVPLEDGVNAERIAQYQHPLYRLMIVLSGQVAPPAASSTGVGGSLLKTGADGAFSRP